MLNITSRKHKIFAAVISMAAFFTIGTVGLSTNSQAVSAKTRTIYVQSTKLQNHYIKLANRPGTHYFKGYKVKMASDNAALNSVMDEDKRCGTLAYKMNGQIDKSYDPTVAFAPTIIGTKTVGSKHFFITRDDDGKHLALAKDFKVPTMYRLKKGHHITAYDIPFLTNKDGVATYRNFGNPSFEVSDHFNSTKTRFLAVNTGTESGLVPWHGEKYRAFYITGGYGAYFKQSDIKKHLVPAKGMTDADKYNGNHIVHIDY